MQAISWGGWSALEEGDRPLAQISGYPGSGQQRFGRG